MTNTSTSAITNARNTSAGTRLATAGLALCMLVPSLSTSIANVALPDIAVALHAPFARVQYVVQVYLLAITVLSVLIGRVADRLGRRGLLLAGIALYALASVLCAFAPSLNTLLAARAVQGTGAATMLALSLASVGDVTRADRTGRAVGALATMSSIGTALGPVLGGIVVHRHGWRMVFLASVPLALGAIVLLAAAAFTARRHTAHTASASSSTLNVPGMPAPQASLPLMRREPLRSALATSTLISAVTMTSLVVGPFYLTGALGLDAAHMGLAMSVGPLVSASTGIPAGRLADRLGTTWLLTVALACLLTGCLAMSLMPSVFGLAGYLLPLALVTAGQAMFQTANNTSTMSRMPARLRGTTSGALSLSRNLGLMSGSALMTRVFALGGNTSETVTSRADALTTGMRLCFGAAAMLVLLAFVISRNTRSLTPLKG